MKRVKIIPALLSVFLSAGFLIGSSGFSVVIHECSMCGDISLSFSSQAKLAGNEDNCCGNTDTGCAQPFSGTVDSGCCTFKIENFKLVNYKPSVLYEMPVIEAPVNDLVSFNIQKKVFNVVLPVFAMNKHGGREIIISNHQIIS